MKIVLVGSAHPLRGGLASFNERLTLEFIHQGEKMRIETFSLQYPKLLFPGKTQNSVSPAPEGIPIHVSVNSVNPFNWIRVGHKIKKEQPDIVLFKFWMPFMGPCFGTISWIIRKNKHTKIIAILDNLIPHEKRPGDKILTNYFVSKVDGFIAMSKSVFDQIPLFDKRKPKVLTPHPLFDNFGPSISKRQAINNLGLDPSFKYVLFFGFIRDYKGLDLLLEAFTNKAFHEQKIKLIVAGEFYSDGKKYLDIIEKNNLKDEVILRTDFIPNEEVANYFCASDIIAQPYKSATQSGVTQIGYHYNKPMLVTNVGGLAEIIPHGEIGYVVSPSKEEIANALIDFFTNNKIDTFEQNIPEYKKKYSWEIMYQRIIELYQKIENDNQK